MGRKEELILKIWIDADACPGAVTEVVSRAAHKLHIDTVFVANKLLRPPESPYISTVLVKAGMDVADAYIAEQADCGDLVVTNDVPLASLLVPRGVVVISPRGDLFDEHNIGERLSSRDLMQSLRETGTITGGPEPFNEKHKRAFANRFDAALQRLRRG